MTMIGYARCSTTEQNTDDQEQRLTAAGCARVFSDPGVSGKLAHRPQWDACQAYLRTGDILAVTKLDRAGRSIKHLIAMAEDLRERGIGLKVLDQGIDTTSAAGMLFFHLIAAFADFEHTLIRERTHEGLSTARARGHKSGRREKLSPKKQAAVVKLFAGGAGITITEIAEMYDVSRTVIYRILNKERENAA